MPNNRKVTLEQLKVLVSWMEVHPMLAKNVNLNSTPGKQFSQRLWAKLTSRLNAISNGITKSQKDWRQYWSDQKCRVRKKIRPSNQASGTPGGACELTPIEVRILNTLGVLKVENNQNVCIPFDMCLDDSPPRDLPSPTPAVEEMLATMPACRQSTCSPAITVVQARPPKRKHVTARLTEDQNIKREHVGARLTEDYNVPPPQWAVDIETRRLEEDMEWRRVKLEMMTKQAEEERAWRASMLNAINKIADALSNPPPPPMPPSPFQ